MPPRWWPAAPGTNPARGDRRSGSVEQVKRRLDDNPYILIFKHFKKIIQLAENNISGKTIQLPNGFIVRYEYKKLKFSKTAEKLSIGKQVLNPAELEVPGQTTFNKFLIKASILEINKVDFDKYLVLGGEFSQINFEKRHVQRIIL